MIATISSNTITTDKTVTFTVSSMIAVGISISLLSFTYYLERMLYLHSTT